jgi:hypothetical protein
VVVASRPLGASSGWHELDPGSALHVRGSDRAISTNRIIDVEPRFRLADDHVDEGAVWNGARRSVMRGDAPAA